MNLLVIDEFKDLQSRGHVVIDTRQPENFCDGFIKNSLSMQSNENFIATYQELVEDEQKALIVANENEISTIAKTLKNAGIQNVSGFLANGFETWKAAGEKIDMLISIEADEFAIDYLYDEFFLIDVRTKEEYELEHIEDSENLTLNDIEQMLVDLEESNIYYVYANTFAEALTAGSLFKRNGFERVRVVAASLEELKQTKIPFDKKKKENSPSGFSNN
jgi:rhodanese-related sulfurtransferase